MLNRNEFRTIWELAFRWEGLEPPEQEPSELPEGVTDKIDKIIWAFRRERLPLRHPSTLLANPDRDSAIELLFIDRTLFRLRRCQKRKDFRQKLLDQLYVMRPELLDWCDKDRIDPPAFWGSIERGSKLPVGRHFQEEIDKNRCQAIAQTLWDIDPSIHPAHMAESKYLQQYGNGAQCRDEATVKRWIADVDPKKGERRPGRPARTRYLIDLENGGLA
ncbi:MAG: hypothetical protein PHT19_15905 [Methylococcus sp.]|nr:hypothetical protein [Methylococcus sp.]